MLAVFLMSLIAFFKGTIALPVEAKFDLYQSLGEELAHTQHADQAAFSVEGVNVQSPGFFEKLLDLPKLDKLCKNYDNKKSGNAGVNLFLQTVCMKWIQVLKKNAECLSGIEQNVRPGCEQVCHQQVRSQVKTFDGKCGLVACVSRCVDVQMSECLPTDAQTSVLLRFYSEVMSSVLLTNLHATTREELIERLNKLPDTCAKMLQTATQINESESADVTAQHHLGNQF